MAEVSGRDLAQFMRWYTQAGTPVVKARGSYDAAGQRFSLSLEQRVPPTPGQPEKAPMVIPVTTALLGRDGRALPLRLAGATSAGATELVLELTQASQTFTFEGVAQRPVPSLLRGFSAPVILETDDDEPALLLRLAHDADPYNRVEAGQELFVRHMIASVQALSASEPVRAPSPSLVGALRAALATVQGGAGDPALIALALAAPTIDVVADRLPWADYARAHEAREHLIAALAAALEPSLRAIDAELSDAIDAKPYRFEPTDVGRRSLRNVCVAYLARLPSGATDVAAHLTRAQSMTDTQHALALLAATSGPARDDAFAAFYARWHGEALMIDKWFALQAGSACTTAIDDVSALVKHPAFSLENPNRARSVVAAFGMNHLRFHDASGRGYVFLADQVRALDAFNPQVAARMVTPLLRWKRQDAPRQALMQRELRRVLGREGCSKDMYEQVTKALADAPAA
jgi:aminopeptidase N